MYINELLHVLFYKNIDQLIKFVRELDEKYSLSPDSEQRNVEYNDFIKNSIGTKDNFIKLIHEYHMNQTPLWQNQINQHCDLLSQDRIRVALDINTYETGKKRYEMYHQIKKGWAVHLDDYSERVNIADNNMILELATGAGLGLCAVIDKMKDKSRVISTDIDFACVKNADALARYYDVTDRVCGINANFWMLPFENDVFDVVCTHYGLDESGEINRTISEIVRVLKNKGRFVCVCRQNAFIRTKRYFELFDISESEAIPLLNSAKLYSNFESLVEIANDNGLRLIEYINIQPGSSHNRILSVFELNG